MNMYFTIAPAEKSLGTSIHGVAESELAVRAGSSSIHIISYKQVYSKAITTSYFDPCASNTIWTARRLCQPKAFTFTSRAARQLDWFTVVQADSRSFMKSDVAWGMSRVDLFRDYSDDGYGSMSHSECHLRAASIVLDQLG